MKSRVRVTPLAALPAISNVSITMAHPSHLGPGADRAAERRPNYRGKLAPPWARSNPSQAAPGTPPNGARRHPRGPALFHTFLATQCQRSQLGPQN
jgi:hypothetical protein